MSVLKKIQLCGYISRIMVDSVLVRQLVIIFNLITSRAPNVDRIIATILALSSDQQRIIFERLEERLKQT